MRRKVRCAIAGVKTQERNGVLQVGAAKVNDESPSVCIRLYVIRDSLQPFQQCLRIFQRQLSNSKLKLPNIATARIR